jgi:hypothetical protein
MEKKLRSLKDPCVIIGPDNEVFALVIEVWVPNEVSLTINCASKVSIPGSHGVSHIEQLFIACFAELRDLDVWVAEWGIPCADERERPSRGIFGLFELRELRC